MDRKIKFSSGAFGSAELPEIPRVRASVREPGLIWTVARAVRYNSRARPRQSKPAPRFAVEAGTRTSIERSRGEVIEQTRIYEWPARMPKTFCGRTSRSFPMELFEDCGLRCSHRDRR